MYTDNDKKISVILNKKHETATQMNALGHAVVGLTDVTSVPALRVLDYEFAGEVPPARISTYPVIVLVAPNSSQLHRTWLAALDLEVDANPFTLSMVGGSAAEQQSATLATPMVEHDFVALALFGAAEDLRTLTRKFSVLR